MTNDVNARAVRVYGGWQGEFRKVHRADWEPVRVNGTARIHDTPEAAELAAWRALRSHLCGDIAGFGEPVSGVSSRAESLFGAIFKNGRKIGVVRK